MNEYLDYLLEYFRYALHWVIKYLWALIVPFYLIAVIFPASFWWLWLILWASLSYNAFLNSRQKGVLSLFKMPGLIGKNRKVIFAMVIWIEAIFMVIACYILNKGLQTITGVQETLFGIPIIALSIAMAVGISLFMFWLLYTINNTYDRKFIIGYILLDAVILMPFNFMFIYENNQNENMVVFHGREIPSLADKLNINYTVKRSYASNTLSSAKGKNRNADSAIATLLQQKENLSRGAELAIREERSPVFYNTEIGRINGQIRRLRTSKDTLLHVKESAKEKYDLIAADMEQLRPMIDSIKKTYSKDSYARNVSLAKERILSIAARDTTILNDSAVARSISALQVKPEAPTDAFIQLCRDMVALPGKVLGNDKQPLADSTVNVVETPEQAWKMKQEQSRWLSFMPSILIDIIPLLAAIFVGALRKKFD